MKRLFAVALLLGLFGCGHNPVEPQQPVENHNFPKITVYSVAPGVPNPEMSTASFRVVFLRKSDLPTSVYAYGNNFSSYTYSPNSSFQESDSSYLYMMSVSHPPTLFTEIDSITFVCKYNWTSDSTVVVAHIF